jgi:hypothetical protein
MVKLTPIKLDNNTVIFIECAEDTTVPTSMSQSSLDADEALTPKGLWSFNDSQDQAIHSFKAVEATIRAYTTYALNSFKNLAIANVDKITLTFGIEIGGEAGVPYITKGTAKSNLNITVECSFPKESEEDVG